MLPIAQLRIGIDELLAFHSAVPLAEQIAQLRIGIDELLAFHSAVFDKAEAQGIPPETAAYKVAEEIKQYPELSELIKQHGLIKLHDEYLDGTQKCGYYGPVPIAVAGSN